MLSGRGRAVAVATVVLLVLGRVLGITELFGIAAVSGLLVVAALFQVRAGAFRVSLSGSVAPGEISRGDEAILELVCENAGTVPTPADRLYLASKAPPEHVLVPRLVPGERATAALALDTSIRGRHLVRGYDALVTDALGLGFRRLASSKDFEYLVRPASEELPQVLPLAAGGEALESIRSAAERLHSGTSLLRGYLEGDDLRRVHWRTTARVGDLMIREGGEAEVSGRSGTTVAFVTHAVPGPDFERAVEVAASILRAAATAGRFRLVTSGGYDSQMSAGGSHLDVVTVALSTLTASSLPPRGQRAEGRTASTLAGMWHLLDAGPRSPDTWGTVITVEVLDSLIGGSTRASDELQALPARQGPVVRMLVGGDVTAFDPLERDRVVVTIPRTRPLGEIWSLPLDQRTVPAGAVCLP